MSPSGCIQFYPSYFRQLLKNETENSCYKVITKCDRLLLQSASGITKCDSYYKVRRNIYVFLRIIRSHNGIGYEEKSRKKIWTREWLLKGNERGAYNGILNELRLTDKEDFRNMFV